MLECKHAEDCALSRRKAVCSSYQKCLAVQSRSFGCNVVLTLDYVGWILRPTGLLISVGAELDT